MLECGNNDQAAKQCTISFLFIPTNISVNKFKVNNALIPQKKSDITNAAHTRSGMSVYLQEHILLQVSIILNYKPRATVLLDLYFFTRIPRRKVERGGGGGVGEGGA